MKEYKIIEGLPNTIQMKLNQWRHDYRIKILSMQVNPNPHHGGDRIISILLTRKKK